MSSAVEFAKLEETQDYNEKQYGIQQAELAINREQLFNEYQNQVLSYQNSILSAKSQRDSYEEAKELTETVNLPQAYADLESYESLLGRWDSNFTATMTAAKQEGQSNYETLLGNFANMGVANAETGREGATADLLEGKQKQNVIDYVGSDMQLDQNGGLFGMAITEQALDLMADKTSYQNQVDILRNSIYMYEDNLKEYDENMDEIDSTIEEYQSKIEDYKNYVNKLQTEWGLDKLSSITGETSALDLGYDELTEELDAGTQTTEDKEEVQETPVEDTEISSIVDYGEGLYVGSDGNRYIVDADGHVYSAEKTGTGYSPTQRLTNREVEALGSKFTSLSANYTTEIGTQFEHTESLDDQIYDADNWTSAAEGLYEYTVNGKKKKIYIKNGVMYMVAVGPNDYSVTSSTIEDTSKVANYGLQKVSNTTKKVYGV